MNSPLNVKTCYSMIESLIKIDDYISFAKENNIKYLSILDSQNLYGHLEFYNKCLANNIKPILGTIFYLEYKSTKIRINLFAKNYEGLKNIFKLSSYANVKNKILDINILKKYLKNNILIITPKAKNKHLINNIKTETNLTYGYNFFLGMYAKNTHIIDYIKEIVPSNSLIWFHPIRYLKKHHKSTYKVLTAMKLQKLEKEVFINGDYSLETDLLNNDYKENVETLINQINIEIPIQSFRNNFVKYQTPDNISSFYFLKDLCKKSLYEKFKGKTVSEKYINRLRYEITIIKQMGFEDYFLVVYDYVYFAKQKNIYVGPGRGSATGSLVSYLLGITTVDPIKYNLLFERFLNPERKSMPDIDIDFEDTRREEIIEYLVEKYGLEKVALITTFQKIAFKSAIKDTFRVFGLENSLADKISKMVNINFNENYVEAINNGNFLRDYAEKYDYIFKHIPLLIGLPRQTGTHAAGIVISNSNLDNIIPIREGYLGVYQTQFSMENLENFGLIKMDLLGLRNLSTLHDIVNNTQIQNIDLNKIDLHNKKTYALLQMGLTNGIFQLESPGMTKLLMDMKVNSLEEIAITSSLYRPGPQDNIKLYLERQKDKSKISYLDPRLKDILKETNGIMIYQEQIILVAVKVANFSMASADILRRAMSKKKMHDMEQQKQIFIQGAIQNKYLNHVAEAIWNEIYKFANYGFNKSHAISYSLLGYWLAYFKANYPGPFLSSLLNNYIGAFKKTNLYINESKILNIDVIAPNVNKSIHKYIFIDNKIYAPLSIIKQVSVNLSLNIFKEREKNGNYKSIFDFYRRIHNYGLNKKSYEALVWSGALDCFEINRQTLIDNYEVINNYYILSCDNDGNFIEDNNEIFQPNLIESISNFIIESKNEFDYLGVYFKNHPIKFIRQKYNLESKVKYIKNINKNNKYVNILGYISRIKTISDKNNNIMAFIDLVDETGEFNITCFSSFYNKYMTTLKEGNVIIANISVQFYKKKLKGIINKIKLISEE